MRESAALTRVARTIGTQVGFDPYDSTSNHRTGAQSEHHANCLRVWATSQPRRSSIPATKTPTVSAFASGDVRGHAAVRAVDDQCGFLQSGGVSCARRPLHLPYPSALTQ